MSRIRDLITGLLTPFALLESTILAVMAQRNVDDAVGFQLTQLGTLVGQPRRGITDDDLYRRYVRARILANRSDGQPEHAYRIVRAVLGESLHTLRLVNEGAAAFTMRIETEAVDWTIADAVINFLRKGASGGVRVVLEFAIDDPDDAFTFSNTNDYIAGNGFSATNDYVDGPTGALISAME